MIYFIIIVGVFCFTYFGLHWYKRWSKERNLLDIPNERSSHETPTPVGGGIFIVAAALAGLLALEFFGGYKFSLWPFICGGLVIAIVSAIDDIKHVPALVRFFAHLLAASLVVSQMPGIQNWSLGAGVSLPFGYLGALVSVLWIVWMTNAFNFMDGIDGLAATQAVIGSAAWAIIGVMLGIDSLLIFSIILLGAAAGFLAHNWPPATVFMGDVGSAFLGFTFGAMPFIAVVDAPSDPRVSLLPIACVAILWMFLIDTLLTFFQRGLSGERVWTAHRKHFYQTLVTAGAKHRTVTIFYGLLMVMASAAAVIEIKVAVPFLIVGICSALSLIWLLLVAQSTKLTE